MFIWMNDTKIMQIYDTKEHNDLNEKNELII